MNVIASSPDNAVTPTDCPYLKEEIMLMATEQSVESNISKPVHAYPRRRQYLQLETQYQADQGALWTYMKPFGIPCCNEELVEELHHNSSMLKENDSHFLWNAEWHRVNFFVIASRHPSVFNLGGDLALFIDLIRTRNREALLRYASLCIDAIYTHLEACSGSIVSIALVEGDAMGGGLEICLATDLIVAERGTRLGFPEIIFNLFPGMSAYSMLTRKVGRKIAETLLTSGIIYTAEELAKLGVVDHLAPKGEGEKTVQEVMRKHSKNLNGLRSIFECRRLTSPVTHQELQSIAELWVETAMQMEDSHLNIMSRLVRSQRQAYPKYATPTSHYPGMDHHPALATY